MRAHNAKFSYDEFEATWYYLGGPGTITVNTDHDEDNQRVWDVDLGLGRQIEQYMADKILEGKIKFVNADDPENKSLWVSPPSQRAYIIYRIDEGGNGQWLAAANATLRESIDRSKPSYSWKRETREFPISDELFYKLLAKAEEEIGK
jgi:hypothetical protein